MTPTKLAGIVFATVMVLSGCSCRTSSGTKQSRGEIGVVFEVDGASMTGRDAVYDFGSVFMGQTQPLKLVVKNLGSGTLGLMTLEKDSGDAVSIGGAMDPKAVFEVAFEAREVGPSDVTEYEMTFRPPTNDQEKIVDHQVKLVLRGSNTNEGEETAVITLKGRAVSGVCELPPPVQYLKAEKRWVLDFGAVAKGDQYKQTLEIKNPTQLEATAFVSDPYSSSGDHLAFTFAPESARGTIPVPANGMKPVMLQFAPTEVKGYLAFAKMRMSAQCPEFPVELKGEGVDAVLTWQPATLDFGYVTPGISVTKELVFTNAGNSDVTLSQIATTAMAEFKVVPEMGQDPTKLSVPGKGGSAKLVLSFKPSVLGPRSAMLTFKTTLAKQPTGQVQLRGYGGGPDIDVKPANLAFGKVAYFSNANPPSFQARKLTVMNVGTKPAVPDANANLKLGDSTGKIYDLKPLSGVTDTSEISVTVPPQYNPAVGLEASAGKNLVDLVVKVTPNGTGQKSWELTIYSNDPDEPEVKVVVSADVVVLPPCNYSVTPTALNFGLVTPPSYKDLSFTVKNLGQNQGDICLLSGLDIQAGSDAVFSLPAGRVDSKELQPNESFTVTVRAWPQGQASQTVTNVTGNVEFFMSSPTQPQKVVNLAASIALGCLSIAPSDLDFGTVQKGCNSSTRTFNIYNTCTTPVTINSASMQAAAGQQVGGPDCPTPTPNFSFCPEFFLIWTASTPLQLAPGATPVSFTAKYRPIDYGSDSGAIAINAVQNGQNVTYVVTLQGKGDTVGLNKDVFVQDAKPKADLLLVIDDSCSMSDEQQSLATNFASFIKYAITAGVDYHLAVTTTEFSRLQGKFFTGPTHPEKVLTPTTPDVENKFKQKVQVGTNGALEECFRPALTALTPPLITADNAGFLRNDASLAIVCVTDEPEQSPDPVTYYYNNFLNIKGAKRANMFSLSAIAGFTTPIPSGCSYTPDNGNYAQMVQMTNGVKENICTPNWAKTLEALGKTAFGFRTNFFLNGTPDLTNGKTITVTIDGQNIPATDSRGSTVWTYDPVANSINFEPMFVPEPGQTLEITYYVACL